MKARTHAETDTIRAKSLDLRPLTSAHRYAGLLRVATSCAQLRANVTRNVTRFLAHADAARESAMGFTQFGDGSCTLSITNISTKPGSGRRLSPSCSRSAVKISGTSPGSLELSGPICGV